MKTTILSALLLLTIFLHAQTGRSPESLNEVDYKINAFLNTWNIPGASVAITKDGNMVYNKSFGYSDLERTKKSRPDNLYRIASVSKPITAIAVMKLVENGCLSLDDKVFGHGKILDSPYYLNVITDKRIYLITVKDLLEHTSGWDRAVPCDGYPHSDPAFFPLHVTQVLNEPNPVGDSTLIKFSLLKGIVHEPGSTYSYSNVGYLVLGKVIEKISGMSYESFVQKNVLTPSGITDMSLGKNLLSKKQKGEVEYTGTNTDKSSYGDGVTVPSQYGGFNIEAMNAHGGWIASAADLTKLMLAVDGFDTSPDILRASTIELMSEPGTVNANYANGWSVNAGNSWWHTGSMDGTASFICRTNNGYTWAFLFNSRSDNSNEFWKAFDHLPWECLNIISNTAALSNANTPELYPLRGVAP